MNADPTFSGWSLDPTARDRIRVGLLAVEPLVAPDAARRAAALERRDAALDALRNRWAGRTPGSIEECRPARDLYRAFGIDPTKVRPSSEALLRRVLKGASFPEVFPAVDWGNLVAVVHQRPLGLYDRDVLHEPCVVREGAPGESYAGIRKGEIRLEGRPVLADREGPFGNPTSDSSRTAVGPDTRRVLMAVLEPADAAEEAMASRLRDAWRRARDVLAFDGTPAANAACLIGTHRMPVDLDATDAGG